MKQRMRKYGSAIAAVLFLLFSCLVLSAFALNSDAFAAETEYLSPELYTSDDHLLNADGTVNNGRTIVEFAEAVKAAGRNQVIEELTQVIPLEYLECQEEYATLAYMGKEYGFYIYKYGENFFTLLIDFVIDDEHANAQYSIKINPILQQCFRRAKDYGVYKWIKYDDDRYKFYVENPRFSAAVLNENALNHGDVGYSMQSDDGVIIRQSRINYSGLLSPMDSKLLETIADLSVQLALGVACPVLDLLPVKLGTIIGLVNTATQTEKYLFGADGRQTVYCNNETNLYAEMTKTEQLRDGNADCFSKNINVMPKDSTVLLSDANESFAELKVLLSDSNYRSRIVRKCEFDIGCMTGVLNDKYESMTSPEDNNSFGFYDERTIFENEDPYFYIGDDFDKSDMPVYLLPQGNQIISFTPTYSGEYTFQPPAGTTLSLNGAQGRRFDLVGGQKYRLILSNTLNATVISNLPCTVRQYNSETEYRVLPQSNYIVGYQPSVSEFHKIEAINFNVKLRIIDENMQTIAASEDNRAYSNFTAGRKYYFVVENDGGTTCTTQINISSPSTMNLSQDYDLNTNEKALKFTNFNETETCYKLQLSNSNDATASIIDIFGRNLITATEHSGSSLVYTFTLGANEECLIRFHQKQGQTVAHIFASPTQCRWLVDGQIVNGANVRLKPNSIHNITAEISSDGSTFETINSFIVSASATDYSFANDKLRIGSLANFQQITITPTIAPDFVLTVIVDDMITKITLNHNGGTGYTGVISVELNGRIPSNLPKPTRKGYTFKGYYNTKQNSDINTKQYITALMQGQIWDVDVDNATLYAYWEQSVYTLTLDNGIGSRSRYFRYRMCYGDSMPTDRKMAPKKDGYHFLGYYADPVSTAEKYYSVTAKMFDDRQSANIYGCENYYVEGMEFCHSNHYWTRESDLTLYAHWEPLHAIYFVKEIIEGQGESTSQRISIMQGEITTVTPRSVSQADFKCFMLDGEMLSGSSYDWSPTLTWDVTTQEVIPTQDLIALYTPKQCVAAGTLITLSDGRQVPIETLTGNETLLVWNMMTGQLDSSKILFIDKDPQQIYKVINLSFSDGTDVKVISEHAFWDYNLSQYVYLREDASQYIGHWFNSQGGKVQLVSVEVREELTTVYSPITSKHFCYYVNGMLSMPGGITGLINIFEVDSNTMTINRESMSRDIEKYGLFTYAEFAELLPVSEEIFNAFNGQYLKVAIGKGLIDFDSLCRLVQQYSKFFV